MDEIKAEQEGCVQSVPAYLTSSTNRPCKIFLLTGPGCLCFLSFFCSFGHLVSRVFSSLTECGYKLCINLYKPRQVII